MGLSVGMTLAPNGQRQSSPSLYVCIAKGMPMIVMAKARLPVKYPKAASRPPHNNHTMLANVFIFLFISVIKLMDASPTLPPE